MPRPLAFTQERKEMFLEALERCGEVKGAAMLAGVGTSSIAWARKRDARFAARVEEALGDRPSTGSGLAGVREGGRHAGLDPASIPGAGEGGPRVEPGVTEGCGEGRWTPGRARGDGGVGPGEGGTLVKPGVTAGYGAGVGRPSTGSGLAGRGGMRGVDGPSTGSGLAAGEEGAGEGSERAEVAERGICAREGRRYRHDGFSREKRKLFLKTLARTGCVKDACRKAGISDTTAYRFRGRDADLAEKWDLALQLAAPRLEAIAFKRATEGTEEKVYREGKLVSVKVKASDAMLRLLLQGSRPDKYGRTGGGRVTEEQVRKLKEKIREEAREEWEAELRERAQEAQASIVRKWELIRRSMIRDKGYWETPEGCLIPAGYGRLDGAGRGEKGPEE